MLDLVVEELSTVPALEEVAILKDSCVSQLILRVGIWTVLLCVTLSCIDPTLAESDLVFATFGVTRHGHLLVDQ